MSHHTATAHLVRVRVRVRVRVGYLTLIRLGYLPNPNSTPKQRLTMAESTAGEIGEIQGR